MNRSKNQNRDESVGMWAWFLPAAYVAHVAEEAFGGNGLMEWMAAGGGVRLSLAEFIGLNLAGAGMMCLAAWAARKSKDWRWPLVSGATIIFVNGIWHIAVCVMTRSYVPGVWTGLLLYVTVGGILLFRTRRLMPPWLFASATAIGMVIHGVTIWLVLQMPGFQMGGACRVRQEQVMTMGKRVSTRSAGYAIFWADPRTGLIIDCNKTAEALLERKKRDIVGSHQKTIHPPEKADHYFLAQA